MGNITLPHKFKARPYQKDLFDAFGKYKRMIVIWHRRAGKDKSAFQLLLRGSLERVWVYYYIFPEYAQGRKIFWDGIDNDGMRMRDHIPKGLIKTENEQQMKIELVNGSIIQVVGTDKKIDNIVGTNPVGCLFSEFPISDPRWWDLIRPILTLNGGWAIFVYTPRGKNHGYKMREVARKNPDSWFLSEKTCRETFDNEGNRIVTDEMIEQERRDGMDEDLIQQEYFVSFEAAIKWAYYADQIRIARSEGRFGALPLEPNIDVHTFWDLGMNDTTVIWFAQFIGKECRLIDHYEMSGEGLEHYVGILRSKPYKYGTHYLPHDAEVRELQSGISRKDYLTGQGLTNIKIVPRLSVQEGIDAVRRHFKNFWFDENKCERGINAISSYHKDYDDKNQVARNQPKHDWASNSSDALRYLAVMYDSMTKKHEPQKIYVPRY
jgi:phage terminase large subunit